jgi:raffinose/stachyose/melibiose transport system substrate-binding protein
MGKAWNAAKTEFEATHPGVTVVMDNSRGFEQIMQTASMVLNSNEAPDVMEYNKGNATAGLLSSQGLLTDMTDEVVKRGWDKILTGGLSTTSRYKNGVMGSGAWYGVTDYGEFVMVYYNKKLFADNNVQVPATLDEMVAAMDKFKAAGLVPIATGATEYPAQQIFYELVLSKADQSLTRMSCSKPRLISTMPLSRLVHKPWRTGSQRDTSKRTALPWAPKIWVSGLRAENIP